MTTTDRDIQALHYIAQRLRAETNGARKWDDAGLTSVLSKLKGHNLAITVERVTRHAGDAEARTPGAIERPFVPDAPTGGSAQPLRPSEACRNCGRAKHGPHAECDGRVPLRTADVSAPVAHLRAIRDEATAELCGHGVALANCLDHRKRQDDETDARRSAPTQGA